MGSFGGRLQVSGVLERPIDVQVDLDQQWLSMSSDGREIGSWPLAVLQIAGRDDGFAIQIRGIPATLNTSDDGAFANQLGLRWASPRLRRLMAVDHRKTDEMRRSVTA